MGILDIFSRKKDASDSIKNESNTLYGQTQLGNNLLFQGQKGKQTVSQQLLYVTTSSTTAYTDFADLSFTSATITAYGAMIYNDSATGNPSVCILDFGGAKTSTAGTFTIIFPTADASSAIIRIA